MFPGKPLTEKPFNRPLTVAVRTEKIILILKYFNTWVVQKVTQYLAYFCIIHMTEVHVMFLILESLIQSVFRKIHVNYIHVA